MAARARDPGALSAAYRECKPAGLQLSLQQSSAEVLIGEVYANQSKAYS
jgi:hypothetical protein